MLKRAAVGLITLFCSLDKLVHFAEQEFRSGALSTKMTLRADLRLKTLFWTNGCPLLKIAKKW